MKVLAIAPYVSSVYGGPGKVAVELIGSLAKFDLDIDLITTKANYPEVKANCWVAEDNYRIRYFNCWHKDDFIISPGMLYWLLHNISNYDLVHTNTLFSPLISGIHWLCQFYNIPYISTPHGMLEPWALSYKARKKQIYFNLIEKPALQKASAIHALVTSEANNIKSLGINSPIKVLPNGIHWQDFSNSVAMSATKPSCAPRSDFLRESDVPSERRTSKTFPESEILAARSVLAPAILRDRYIFDKRYPQTKNKQLILFLGRIDPKKGLDLLAPAFSEVYRQFPNTHLVVAGPDNINYLPEVKSFFQQEDCLEAVTFTGMLTGDLKKSALAAASIYVAPSYSEGFSMSVLEGMASALPCIITTGCNFPEAARDKVARVVEIDSNAIAGALIDCLASPEQAQIMGDRAREYILQNYTWDIIAQKLIEVYRDLTDDKIASLNFI